MKPKFSLGAVFFYLIVIAIVYTLVRPGSQAAEAMIAVTAALAALISAAEGQPHSSSKAGSAMS